MEGEDGDRPHPDIRRPPLEGESDMIDIKHGIKRARDDRWFMGVCGGIAHTYGWQPNTVRLVMVILALAMPGPSLLLSLLAYLVLGALLSESDEF
jgi:phage shock protein PspC (stress-responsive transcriptional regulator)